MKHLSLILGCMGIFFRLSSAAFDTLAASKDDKGSVTFTQTQHFTINASSKNSNAVTSDTSVEQASNSASEADSKKIRDMSPPYSPCRKKYNREFIACMHRLPRELYQKILLTINPEEVEYYYDQLTIGERIEMRTKKFTDDEWATLSVAKPWFTRQVDTIVRVCKK